MTSVFVFPGQGSQRKGMGQGLFEKFPELVAEADELLGYSIEQLCLRDPDRVLNNTEYTQPALYVVNVLHHLDRVERDGEWPQVVAGHSLGEYCALFAAGGFDFGTGLRLVRRRGELMSMAPKGAMAAVLNLDHERVVEILAGLPYQNIDLANINSREQCILSGVYDELFAPDVREAYVGAGASFVPLNVSAAFHSRCMVDVQEEFARYLAGFELKSLRLPVIANYTARPHSATGYADHLIRQISGPVRWYESMSWLIAQGYRAFHEIGPGAVLTKLTEKILGNPLPIEPPRPPVSTEPRRKLIFMYGGQGTQYYQMGRELYDTNPVFRGALDRCSAAYQSRTGSALVAAIYQGAGKGSEFDDITYSQAALYSIGYSLTEVLREEGFHPDAVLGHSLGEYVAATVAGVMSFEDGLDLVTRQARLLAPRRDGGMLSVLAPPDLFHQRPDIFDGSSLAAVNFSGNFVVSGERDRLTKLHTELAREGVIAVPLPVRHAFHSPLLDEVQWDFISAGMAVKVGDPRLPIYSAMRAGLLAEGSFRRWDEYLWRVVRAPVRFDELMVSAFPEPQRYFFVDLSASGSFANFVKHGYDAAFRCASAINQFGHNNDSMTRLRDELAAAKQELFSTIS